MPVRHNPYLHKIVVTEMSKYSRGKVLDLPSGPGYLIQDLKSLGFDGIAGEIDKALHCLPDVRYQQIDMTKTFDFPDASFDYVTSIEGIEHIAKCYSHQRPGDTGRVFEQFLVQRTGLPHFVGDLAGLAQILVENSNLLGGKGVVVNVQVCIGVQTEGSIVEVGRSDRHPNVVDDHLLAVVHGRLILVDFHAGLQ